MNIPQPGDKSITVKASDIELSMKLKWNPRFGSEYSKRFWQAQCFVDSECIRHMSKYTPYRTGQLIRSVTLGTKIGSGRIVYNSPYARYQYYGVAYGPNYPVTKNGAQIGWWSPPKKHPTNRELEYSTHKNPSAQKLWFEKMKQEKGQIILESAAKIAGGRA